mmetsp:Transcript_13193/g.11060  ORF Transcript_13193/g.11060 Transcript_13193/m.11060 type:complete len:81 (+) Transcript_13193:3-245(+)
MRLVICSLGDRSSKIREIYESQFRQFDMNEDSVIDAQEIRSNFPDLANDHIDSFFRSTDGNKDGLISWEEFVRDSLQEDV